MDLPPRDDGSTEGSATHASPDGADSEPGLLARSRFEARKKDSKHARRLYPITLQLKSDQDGDKTSAVVSLYHRAMPKWGAGRLRRIVKDKKVRTVCVLLPEDAAGLEEGGTELGADELSASIGSIAAAAAEADELEDDLELEVNSDPEGKDSDSCDDRDRFNDEESDDDDDTDDDSDDTDDDSEECEEEDEESDEEEEVAVLEHKFSSRLVACMSFETAVAGVSKTGTSGSSGTTVVQVTLLAVHPRWRRQGVGRQLIQLIQRRNLVAEFSTILACAPPEAVGFFEQNGFSGDPMLNSRFRLLLTGGWHDHRSTVTMCYEQPEDLRPGMLPSERKMYSSLEHLDAQVANWQQARVAEYSQEMGLITRMRNEIEMLRSQVVQRDEFCRYATTENALLKRTLAEKDALIERLSGGAHSAALVDAAAESESVEKGLVRGAGTMLEDVNPASKEYTGLVAEVEASIRESHGIKSVVIRRIRKPVDSNNLSLTFSSRLGALHDPSLNMRFFFGGPNLERVVCDGFTDADMHDHFGFNVYGRGLYFTPFFSKACHFSQGSGNVVLALVGLGKSETVVSQDSKRNRPAKGHDSVCVPGRPLPLGTDGAQRENMEEYVVFHPAQALPMYLISYDVIDL